MKQVQKALDDVRRLWRAERFRIPTQIILVYGLWKVFHHFAWIKGTALNSVWTAAMVKTGTVYAAITSFLLTPFVAATHAKGIDIYISSVSITKVVWVQEHCLAIPAMVIFTATVALFKGKVKDKVWFIPLGLLGIVMINLMRLFFLSLAWLYLSPYFFKMHHSYIYVILTYGFIFLLLRWWIIR